MNVVPAWKKGYSGKGIVVSILDDGIQTNHPDLAQNYVGSTSFFSSRNTVSSKKNPNAVVDLATKK